METFTAVLNTLETLRGDKEGILRSVRKIERLPSRNEMSWCVEDVPLTHLSELPAAEHITSLYLVECRKLTTLAGIATRFPQLQALWVYACDRLTQLDGLQSLKMLEALTIWPSFSSNITVDTLAPLAEAPMLRSLVLSGKSKDGTLTPLYGLEKLRELFLSNSFSCDEFARIEAHRPEVAFPWKGGVIYDANPSVLTCPSCGKAQAMLAGKGLRLCCPNCDAERLAKHVRRYVELAQRS